MKFTERFNELITTFGTNQTEIAEYCCISRQAITEMKSGRSYPSLDTLVKIAEYFNVCTDYLLGRQNCDRQK